MLELIPNWRDVALRSYSQWFLYIGALALVGPELWFLATGYQIVSPYALGYVGLALLLAGMVGRVIKQPKIDRPRRRRLVVFLVGLLSLMMVLAPAARANPVDDFMCRAFAICPSVTVGDTTLATDEAFLDLGVPFVGEWEGLRLTAYQDIVGVWTICYGHTRTVVPGEARTQAQCDALLAEELLEYRHGVHAYMNEPTLSSRLPVQRDVAYSSLAFNVGIAGAGGSTAVRRLNAGDIAGGCAALTWWDRAGGRVVRGLALRRAAEYPLCMIGVGL